MFANYKTLIYITLLLNDVFYEYNGSAAWLMNQKFVVRRDLSDYCKRGVITSVFLGTHVVEANSQILQFSKRETDYSCRFCVRTESGNNIVMVIRNKNDKSLTEICAKGSKQVAVYSMQETFGGYWASMPDFMRETQKYPTGVYTIGTTNPTTTPEEEYDSDSDYDDPKNKTNRKDKHRKRPLEGDYFSIEIPIVNISRKLRPGEQPEGNLLDILLNVDAQLPQYAGEYASTVIPLLNFSVWRPSDENKLISAIKPNKTKLESTMSSENQRLIDLLMDTVATHTTPIVTNELRHSHTEPELLTETEFNDVTTQYTPKTHYTPKYSRTTLTIKNPYLNFDRTSTNKEEVNFTRLSTTKLIKKKTPIITNGPTKLPTTVTSTEKITEIAKITTENRDKSKKIDFFNKVAQPVEVLTNATENQNKTSNETSMPSRRQETANQSSTNPSVSMVDHESWENVVLVAPKMMENLNNTTRPTKNIEIINENETTDKFVDENSTSSMTKNTKENVDLIITTEKILNTDVTKNSTRQLKHKLEDKKVEKLDRKITMGTVVTNFKDVKETSEFYRDLEHKYITTDLSDKYFVTEDQKFTKPKLKVPENVDRSARRKRLIKPISISNVFPRSYNTAHALVNLTPIVFEESNLGKIEQHVERQNDKVNSRISIRYETIFLGEELFNLCDGTSFQSNHVFLFNNSRIMIEIENFVMDMVTIVLTEGRTVTGTNCEEDYLECQLAGNRVCIDAMNACDGVPNCGADDIYDEDRLKCGYLIGIQHDVYLAAFMFLVLVLTLLYIVHYWLKRCVPKVSSAFFVYTDGAEIKLNLGTVMKSPMTDDMEEDKIASTHHLIDYENVFRSMSEDRPSCWQRLKMFCSYYLPKSKRIKMFSEEIYQTSKSFSFPKLEIGKLGRKPEVGVQTSLQMEPLSFKSLPSDSFDEFFELNELNVLNFCRDSACKDCSVGVNTDMPMSVLKPVPKYTVSARPQQYEEVSTDLTPSDESNQLSLRILHGSVELGKRERDRRVTVESVDVHTETMPRLEDKKLRFDEVAVTIDNKDLTDEGFSRSKSVYGTQKLGTADLDAIEVVPEYKPASELRKFLMGKNKKGKKKSIPHLRQS